MRIRTIFAFGVLLAPGGSFSQQPALLTPPLAQTTAAVPPEGVYYAAPDVTAPELLPIKLEEVATGHCKHFEGNPVMSAVIDATGTPHDLYFLKPTGDDLDKIAIKVLKKERFKPGALNGAPTATIVAIELNMKACIQKRKDEAGQNIYALALRSLPDQRIEVQQSPHGGAKLVASASSLLEGNEYATPRKVRGNISAPKPLKTPDPHYSDKARKERIQGVCVVSLIVDSYGMPQNPKIVKSLEESLDQKAIETVGRWRFKPAMKDGVIPVPVMITVEVDFHLY